MNLATGKKEAKLLDDDDEKSKVKALTLTEQAIEEENQIEQSRARIAEALKNIPDESLPFSEERLKKITRRPSYFKTYEEIKKDLKNMRIHVKSDYEIMSELFTQYEEIIESKSFTTEEIDTIFEDFEYLLHQIDNANTFINSGGLDKIVFPNLKNQSTSELKIHSTKLLGILMQNNPKGQIAAFEKNCGFLLLQLLSHSKNTKEMSSALFALGGLLRKFPLAQKEILNKPGLKILVDLLGKQVDYKIKIKCLLLLSDLIRDYNEITNVPFNGDIEKIKQYNAADIKGRLSETDYCKTMDELFNMYRREFLDSLYTTDDMLTVLMMSKDICQPVWAESPIFRHTLLIIKNNYDRIKNKALENDADLDSVTSRLDELHEFLFSHIVIKDEL